MSIEDDLARHLEGKFFLLDGTDKNEDMRLAAEFKTSERAARVDDRRRTMAREAARQKLALDRLKAGEANAPLVVAAVAYAHAVPVEAICGPSRERVVVAARQHAFTVLRDRLNMSFPEIGRYMGRDHSTCVHGVSTWRDLARRYPAQVEVVLDLLAMKQEVAA
jgi:chromosomal replication initiation ATPase DnaA